MVWPTYNPVHFCSYRKTGISYRKPDDSMRWLERCRCGRSVDIVLTRSLDMRVNAVMEKRWFDREGRLERVTGGNVQTEKAIEPLNSSPESGPKVA